MAVEIFSPPQPTASRQQIAGAIKQAAYTTGTSFDYLLTTAKIESNFNPRAAASTSSARGLFQFIDQTWLGTVKEAGGALGYGQYAAAITRSPSGSYSVKDPAIRAEILKLRHDPAISAAMAGVLARSNGVKLGRAIHRQPTDAELYIAHFMGVGGASKLVGNAEKNPHASAASLFPAAASANRSIFYDRSGASRSVSQVYSVLTSRYAAAANSPATRTALASVERTNGSVPAAAMDNAAYLANFPQSHEARAVSPTAVAQASSGSMFRSLFQAGDRPQPVSPAVQKIWDRQSAGHAQVASFNERWQDIQPNSPLDLFSDRNGRFSG